VGLASADPLADPAIFANYLASDEDRRALREGTKLVRAVAEREPIVSMRGVEVAPGSGVQTDAEIDAWIRDTAETIYHPVGTCRMGVDGDPLAVVDAELRVQGLAGLRVVDASVFPTLVGGNTNAPTIMVAEKASDLILGKPVMKPEEAPVFDGQARELAPA
jgi:choline dehydrogenase